MADQRADEQIEPKGKAMKRRGLFAVAAAAIAGIVAKMGEAPVLAYSGGGDQGFLALGSNPWYIAGFPGPNTPATSAAPTVIQATPNFGNFVGQNGAEHVVFEVDARPAGGNQSIDAVHCYAPIGTCVFASGDVGIDAVGTNTGVFAQGGSAGMFGFSNAGPGVSGQSSTGQGVLGQSQSGNAILGEITGFTGISNANTIAIYGLNNSTYAGPGPGAGGFAIYGLCAKGHGLVGATAAAGAAAVVGATNGVAGAYAAAFYGPAVVGGDFTVFGAKSAAVPHPDGSHRRLYCVESPESWFEDVGEAQLTCGQLEVPFDPDFASLVAADQYHVFLTEYGGHNDLTVAERTPRGFRVEAKDRTSEARFSWRVMAKRKDIAGPRLETVTIPPEPMLPPVPNVPVASPPTSRRSR
jgi:hypothetical protein